ncbi:MAG: IS1380 family transposase [Planctomycetes bacterium]|nr:IS1380 family transposase [Planctomycetota bacterium]
MLCKEAFRVSTSRTRKLINRKRRIQNRLRHREWEPQDQPMFTASNIHYELSDKTRGLGAGGIGMMHLLARRTGLIEAIDRRLHLLKVHKPYHESDHVLNMAYNLLAGGECLEDLELLRNDEVYLNALGAQRIPDPTTAGDFCRRFEVYDIQILMRAINAVRTKVWKRQPKAFFKRAIIDADGTLVETLGQCKEGMDISYKGQWGYQVLVVSLANTGEPLFIFNRSGNRPSHEGAAAYYDQAIHLCRQAGFKVIVIRGDTDFTQTGELDRWDGDRVQFIFGIDAMPNLVKMANHLPETAWKPLDRPVKYRVKTQPRQRPENVKEQIVREREFENIRLQSEQVAEFDYQPTLCEKSYRIVVVRKNLSVERGEQVLFDDVRYFFYITNDRTRPAEEIVFLANDRCNQEKLIEQLKNGAKALDVPVDNLVSNWAYMVMASLAWTLKAWYALSLPETGRWKAKHKAEKESVLKMEFKRFLNAFMRVPCQIVRQARRVVYRLLAWNPWQHVFLRGVDALQQPLRC